MKPDEARAAEAATVFIRASGWSHSRPGAWSDRLWQCAGRWCLAPRAESRLGGIRPD